MKFTMKVSDTTAAALIERIVAAVQSESQQWDCVEFWRYRRAPKPTEYLYRREHVVPSWQPEKVVGFSAGSKIFLTRTREKWELVFDGKRGSLSNHWRIVEILQKDGGEVKDYETSIPGMEPWERINDWYRRVTGDDRELHPFDPVNGLGEADYFNRQFHESVVGLADNGHLNGHEIKWARDECLRETNTRYFGSAEDLEEGDTSPQAYGSGGKAGRFAPLEDDLDRYYG